MKALWVGFFMLPQIAEALHETATNKEGWVAGLIRAVLRDGEDAAQTERIEPTYCFAVPMHAERISGTAQGLSFESFREDTLRLELCDEITERDAEELLQRLRPDVVHIFGTEYAHGVAFVRACERVFGDASRVLVGLQGLMGACAEAYTEGLPERVKRGATFRDILKGDSVAGQQRKFFLRAENEKTLLRMVKHVTGRTVFDRREALRINAELVYHSMNETLRPAFYTGRWERAACEAHSVLVSQGNYPLKGLHYALRRLPELVGAYPDLRLYVAGDRITAYGSLKEKLKLSGYGKYLRELLAQGGMEERTVFLGRLSEEEMKERMLKSHVLLSPSVLENSSNSVCEAMLLGLPVVASAVGGLPDMLENGKEGLLYDPARPAQMCESIGRIFADDALAKRLSDAAGKRAAVVHAPEAYKKRLLEIYGEMRG